MKRHILMFVCCATLLGVSGCGRGVETHPIGANGVLGKWENTAGAQVILTADHRFDGEHLDRALPYDGCPVTIKRGEWQFFAPDGGIDRTATSGSEIDLDGSGETDLVCSILAEVSLDRGGYSLCFVQDPDQTCPDDELLRKVRE